MSLQCQEAESVMKKDIDLINEAKGGSQRAFTLLYERYKKSIYNSIYSITKNKDVSDDILSETFTKAFLKIEKYQKDLSFELWLKTIANHNAIDFIRGGKKQRHNAEQNEELTADIILSDYSNPEKDMIKKESIKALEKDINALSSRAREVLTLRYVKGYSYQQIADELGISIGTVKAYISKSTHKIIKNPIN